ncbi:MarR family winged helix-turn-helix transcriptional regulator [Aneurinibacillus sp. REN35]|uniref:MarR family winged helix-turn-helix transcriptional regulator n=1 Tax=Aneurinibacillus sp. REN35 TaxID=3237286 RepID=UPI003529296E
MSEEQHLLVLSNLFQELTRKVAAETSKQFERNTSCQIRGSHAFILAVLSVDGPQKISDLAHRMEITLPSISALADKLVLHGYVERRRADADRRIVLLVLTEKGEEFVRDLHEKKKKAMQKCYSVLSEEEIETIIHIFRKILDNITTQKE